MIRLIHAFTAVNGRSSLLSSPRVLLHQHHARYSLLQLSYRYQSSRTTHRHMSSVTGTVYTCDNNSPRVCLFTKKGCTLCDKVKDVLAQVRDSHPHSLEQVDITDAEHKEWFDKYKYDIPVLHLNGQYWVKHKLSELEIKEAFRKLQEGTFSSPEGEPNAGAMERKS